jgi:hypothetical protein
MLRCNANSKLQTARRILEPCLGKPPQETDQNGSP